MRTDRPSSPVRKRLRAICGATIVVVLLWLLAVLAVNVFVRPAPQLFPQRLRGVVLWRTGVNPVDVSAWHTVLQVVILIALATLVVAGLDRLRRALRRTRRAEPKVARDE
jgi:uncharacterized protein HemY